MGWTKKDVDKRKYWPLSWQLALSELLALAPPTLIVAGDDEAGIVRVACARAAHLSWCR
jgi:hypothetical protein